MPKVPRQREDIQTDALERYLQTLATAIATRSGNDLAMHFAFSDPHRKLIATTVRRVNNLKEFISRRIESPWNDIVYHHCIVISQKPTNDHSRIADLQVTLSQSLHSILQNHSKWILPVVYTIIRDLQNLAIAADRRLSKMGEKANNLEKAARAMNKAFSLCAVDRLSPLADSRKWGVYVIVNLLFKTYFKLSSLNLCKNVLKSLQNADLPPLSEYPKGQQVTFKYYCGVLAFYNENFDQAYPDLLFAFDHGGSRKDASTERNKT
jgi:hypothetical protein